MYIVPNTTIKLIRNCPLDKSYQDTIYFTSVQQQTTFFVNTLEGITLQNNSYQRVNRGVMRVAVNAEQLYNCNYLAFQNASFGNKWFYAFITKVEYVNNVTSEVYYELDVLQTWHFDYVLMQCFVEREHSVTDSIGDNIVDEQLATGEYISEIPFSPAIFTSNKLVIWATFTTDENGNYIDNYGEGFNFGSNYYFSGLTPNIFPLTVNGIDDALAWIENIPPLKLSGLVSANIVPSLAFEAITSPLTETNFSKNTSLMRNDGTAVKNKKCLIYPYNFIYVTNNQGGSAVYRYEFFSSADCEFKLLADVSSNPTVFMYPRYYKGVPSNFDEKVSLNGYPQIAFNVDSYKAWLAQSASNLAVNGLTAGMAHEGYMNAQQATQMAVSSGGAVIGAMAGAEGVMLGAGVGAILALATAAVSGTVHSFMPPQSKGNQGANALFAAGKMELSIYKKHITPEFATIIDDYFSMFGYATKKVKVPNRNARPEWSYVKTIGCKIDPNYPAGLPSDDAEKIESIYNNGVRFWTNPAHIGNYSYDNSPSIT